LSLLLTNPAFLQVFRGVPISSIPFSHSAIYAPFEFYSIFFGTIIVYHKTIKKQNQNSKPQNWIVMKKFRKIAIYGKGGIGKSTTTQKTVLDKLVKRVKMLNSTM